MFSVNLLTTHHKEAWNKLVRENDHAGFQQTFEWADFLEKTGWKSHRIGLFDEKNELLAGCLIYKFNYQGGFSTLHLPEGPVLNTKNVELAQRQWALLKPFISSFIDLSNWLKTTHLRVEARMDENTTWLRQGLEKAPWSLSPRSTQVIDLGKSTEVLLGEMKSKTRYNIKLAEKKGIEVVKFDSKNRTALKQFYSLYKNMALKKQCEVKAHRFFKVLVKKYSQATLFMAYKDKLPLSGAMVLYCGKRATYLFGGSDYKFRMLMAPYLLHWQIIQDAQESGFLEYDLWGISKYPEDQEDEWHGITRFKQGFGGQQVNFLTSLDLIFQEKLYNEFIKRFEKSS